MKEPDTNIEPLNDASPITNNLLFKVVSLVTASVSLIEVAPTIVVAPCTYNVLFKLASSVTYNLLLKFASLVTVKLSLSEAAPTMVVAPCTYNVLLRLASLVTNNLLLRVASLATLIVFVTVNTL